MNFKRKELELTGLELLYPRFHKDERGYFSEVWREEWDIPKFKQENESLSSKGTFRGLHYQWNMPQGKLIRVVSGSALFFELDVRYTSPTFGKCEMIHLRNDLLSWLWVPPGFANSFFALEENTRIIYKCTEVWSKNEGSINWKGIPVIENVIGDRIKSISQKDADAPTFSESKSHLESISDFFRDNSESIV